MRFNITFTSGLKPFLDSVSSLKPSSFDYDESYVLEDPFDSEDVIEISSLEDVEKSKGPLSIAGQMVVLYIKDHGSNVSTVLNGDIWGGRRVHLAYCKTLRSMDSQGRFERYHLSRNPKKYYLISGQKYYWSDETIEGEAELAICKDCLNFLDYDGYRRTKRAERDARTINFDYNRFFSIYSSMFKKMPKNAESDPAGYVKDWKQISIETRISKRFTCEECGFQSDPSKSSFIHVHHVNGNKQDNSDSNLKVLCIDCHRTQPGHGHMWIKPDLLEEFRKAKRERLASLTSRDAYDHCLDFVDPALRSPAQILVRRLHETPEVAFEYESEGRVLFQADVAFVKNRIGLCLDLDESEKELGRKHGWRLLNHNEGMSF